MIDKPPISLFLAYILPSNELIICLHIESPRPDIFLDGSVV